MIFVTVGTHEQQFNRLIEEVDKLKGDGTINEEVIIQSGFSTYEPKNCKSSKLIPYEDMIKYSKEASIVISHGGPASFITPLQFGKIPIVVPRQLQFNEHVNDHQVEFSRAVEEKFNNIIGVYDIKDLKDKILNYKEITKEMTGDSSSNNQEFCKKLEESVEEMFNGKK